MAEAVCPECGGSGWKTVERGASPASNAAHAPKEARSTRLEEASGIPPLYRDASFVSFQLPTDNDIAARDLRTIKDRVSKYASDVFSRSRNRDCC